MKNLIIFVLFFLSLAIRSVYALDTSAKQAILIDAETKAILFEKNAYERMPPSSMSKMMTAYVIFDYIKKGKVKLEDKIIHSENAWRREGSRMFIALNSQVTIDELLKGLIVQSGNDASVSIAEAVSGTEEDFANVMNEYAKELGLKDSYFTNATGLPDERQYSTAYDLAMIAIRTIQDFPEFYKYYSIGELEHNNIKQQNRNTLLYSYPGADGLKTGHTDAGGYGLTFSATKADRRIVGVINGLNNMKERSREAIQFLNYGFMNFSNIVIVKKDDCIAKIPVLYGDTAIASVKFNKDMAITVPTTQKGKVKLKLEYDTPLKAPIKAEDQIATITLYGINHAEETIYPITSGIDIEKVNIVQRVFRNIAYYIKGKKLD